MTPRHIVLVSYGEPPTPSFADQFAYSRRILQNLTRIIAAIPAPLIPLIALSRARTRRRLWRERGYSSPLEAITRAQARRLQTALESLISGGPWISHVAYEFRHPLLGELLRGLPADEPVWVAPMYAADSAFTHELCRQVARDIQDGGGRSAPIRVLPAIEPELLAELSARHVLECLADETAARSMSLVLAAHGTLLEPSRPIDTGRENTERLCQAIQARLLPAFSRVTHGWLNHTRGGRWTEPPIERTFRDLSNAGPGRVAYFPYGFLADNAETQVEGPLIASRHPHLKVRFLPCLNESTILMEAIAAQVGRTLPA